MTQTLLVGMPTKSKAEGTARMKVVGIGDAGCDIINRVMRKGLVGVDFIAMNTDAQALVLLEAPNRILLGEKLTKGLGVDGNPELAFEATEESRHAIEEAIVGAEVVLVIAGMGGGTGTGGIPVVAEIARASGCLTIAVVTKPFSFEGGHRAEVAERGIFSLSSKVDTLIIVPNDRLLNICDTTATVDQGFKIASDALFQATQAICEVTVSSPGAISVEFADIKALMKDAGLGHMSVGKSSGQNRAVEAAKTALTSPLIDIPINEASSVLFNIKGGSSLTLLECNEAAQVISRAVDPNANIVFGVVFDPEMNDEVNITIIAMRFSNRHGEELLGLRGFLSEITGFQEAKAFFEANHKKLLAKYEGKYIAILNREVMDVDDYFSLLAERVYNRYSYRDIYMPKVERRKTILHIPTPQVMRK